MYEALKRHWPQYLTEAAGLAGFIIGAGLLTTLLEHPSSPVQQAMGQSPLLRRVPLGLGMGAYIAAVIYSPWGKQSGAHINPAVTLTFWRLGKIKSWDAIFYAFAQFAGATLAALLMTVVLGKYYAHPSIKYTATTPGPGANGTQLAFIAEFIISFILMLVLLLVINSKQLERLAGLFAGSLIAVYLIFETPYSGMSLNPARSFGSAFAANHWMDLWLYFVSPPLAMLLGAECFLWLKKNREVKVPNYPVEEAVA